MLSNEKDWAGKMLINNLRPAGHSPDKSPTRPATAAQERFRQAGNHL